MPDQPQSDQPRSDPLTNRTPDLAAAARRVLETMCFSTLVGPVEAATAQSTLALAAAVHYSGPSSGTVMIGLSGAAAHALTENFLGGYVDEDDAEGLRQQREFTAELANMICGAVVGTFFGPGPYTLAAPEEVEPERLADLDGLRGDFALDEGMLSVVAVAA
jgi:hypothetical protein